MVLAAGVVLAARAQRGGERFPLRVRDAVHTDRLKADVVGAGLEVGAHNHGDLPGAAAGDHGVEQAIGAAVHEVCVLEAEATQAAGVVAQAQVALRVDAGSGAAALEVSSTHASSVAISASGPSNSRAQRVCSTGTK